MSYYCYYIDDGWDFRLSFPKKKYMLGYLGKNLNLVSITKIRDYLNLFNLIFLKKKTL